MSSAGPRHAALRLRALQCSSALCESSALAATCARLCAARAGALATQGDALVDELAGEVAGVVAARSALAAKREAEARAVQAECDALADELGEAVAALHAGAEGGGERVERALAAAEALLVAQRVRAMGQPYAEAPLQMPRVEWPRSAGDGAGAGAGGSRGSDEGGDEGGEGDAMTSELGAALAAARAENARLVNALAAAESDRDAALAAAAQAASPATVSGSSSGGTDGVSVALVPPATELFASHPSGSVCVASERDAHALTQLWNQQFSAFERTESQARIAYRAMVSHLQRAAEARVEAAREAGAREAGAHVQSELAALAVANMQRDANDESVRRALADFALWLDGAGRALDVRAAREVAALGSRLAALEGAVARRAFAVRRADSPPRSPSVARAFYEMSSR